MKRRTPIAQHIRLPLAATLCSIVGDGDSVPSNERRKRMDFPVNSVDGQQTDFDRYRIDARRVRGKENKSGLPFPTLHGFPFIAQLHRE